MQRVNEAHKKSKEMTPYDGGAHKKARFFLREGVEEGGLVSKHLMVFYQG